MCDAVYYPCVLHKVLELNDEVLSIHHEYFTSNTTSPVPYYFCEGQFEMVEGMVRASYNGGGVYSHRNLQHNTDLNNVYVDICPTCNAVYYYTF